MSGHIGAPVSAVLRLQPSVARDDVTRVLAAWLHATHNVDLESGEYDGLMVEWRASDEDPFACGCAEFAASIILTILGSDACSSVFAFFLRAASPACAFACFCASAAGSSFTSAYSFRIRAATLACCARSAGDGSEGATDG